LIITTDFRNDATAMVVIYSAVDESMKGCCRGVGEFGASANPQIGDFGN